jgi:hypothetical protein
VQALTAYPFQSGPSDARPTPLRTLLLACLVLLAVLAVMLIPHVHQTPSDAEHCALCVVMHSAAVAAVPAVQVILVPLGISPTPAKARAIARYWHPQLFTRPPPQAR